MPIDGEQPLDKGKQPAAYVEVEVDTEGRVPDKKSNTDDEGNTGPKSTGPEGSTNNSTTPEVKLQAEAESFGDEFSNPRPSTGLWSRATGSVWSTAKRGASSAYSCASALASGTRRALTWSKPLTASVLVGGGLLASSYYTGHLNMSTFTDTTGALSDAWSSHALDRGTYLTGLGTAATAGVWYVGAGIKGGLADVAGALGRGGS